MSPLQDYAHIPFSDITSFNTTTAEPTITTRAHMNNVSVPFARTDTYRYLFWNNIPNYIKEINSIEQFKNQIINNVLLPSLCIVFTCKVFTVIIKLTNKISHMAY